MKHIAFVLSLLAAPAMAQGAASSPVFDGTNLICVGKDACSLATHQACSVALGNGVQLPANANHVLATRDGVVPLFWIDSNTEYLIREEALRLGAWIDQAVFDGWNKRCARKELVS